MVELWLSNRKKPQKDRIKQESCQTTQAQEITVLMRFWQRRESDFESAASASSAIPALGCKLIQGLVDPFSFLIFVHFQLRLLLSRVRSFSSIAF